MLDASTHLRRAIGIEAAPDHPFVALRYACCSRNLRAAFRARLWKSEGDFLSRPPSQHHIEDSRDYLSCLLDRDGVADANILLPYVIFVVQRCATDRTARQEHRFEFRHWRQR